MTTADMLGTARRGAASDNRRGGFSAPGLRPADAARRPVIRLAAGPFDISANKRDGEAASLSGALVTGLLVVYPAFATVAAIAVGLFLSSPVSGA